MSSGTTKKQSTKPSSKSYLSRISKVASPNELKNEIDENDQSISVKLGLTSLTNNDDETKQSSTKSSIFQSLTNADLISSTTDSANNISNWWFIFRIVLVLVIVLIFSFNLFGSFSSITQWYHNTFDPIFNHINLLLGLQASKNQKDNTQTQQNVSAPPPPAQNIEKPAYGNDYSSNYSNSDKSAINILNNNIGNYDNAQLNTQNLQGPYNYFNKIENKWYTNDNESLSGSLSLTSMSKSGSNSSIQPSPISSNISSNNSSPNQSPPANREYIINNDISTPVNTPKGMPMPRQNMNYNYGQPIPGANTNSDNKNALSEALAYAAKKSIPSPDDSTSKTQTSGSKSGYCYIGEDRGFRSCIQVGANDTCMSGDIFPTLDVCVNPNLRP